MKNTTLTEEQYIKIQNALICGKVSAIMGKKFADAEKLSGIANGFNDDALEMQAALDTLLNARFAK